MSSEGVTGSQSGIHITRIALEIAIELSHQSDTANNFTDLAIPIKDRPLTVNQLHPQSRQMKGIASEDFSVSESITELRTRVLA